MNIVYIRIHLFFFTKLFCPISQSIHALIPKLFCIGDRSIMPACVINTRYVEVVEIALVCLNYGRMTFRAVALESIAFEVDCSLKVFVPQGGTGPSPKCPSVPK